MTSSPTSESLASVVRAGFGEAASLRVRRPGKVFQVEVPAFLDDGDGVQLYLEPSKNGRLIVSDLGQTLMRISYTRNIDDAALAHVGRLAERNGFSVSEGIIGVEIPESELIPALFGLAQVQAVAEATLRLTKHRGPRAEEFRELVLAALRESFGSQLEERVPLPESPNLYEIDAVLHTARPIAIFAIPNDLEAERAVACRYKGQDTVNVRHWFAVPRDIESLTAKSRDHLLDAFTVGNARFDARATSKKLLEIAA